MLLNDYQIAAHSTAVHGGTLAYPIAALAEEAGEVASVWGRWCAYAVSFKMTYEQTREMMLDEMGDVLWDASEIATLLGIKLDTIYPNAVQETLWEIENKSFYVCNLVAKVAKLNGVWAKYIRKHDGEQPKVDGTSQDELEFFENIRLALIGVLTAFKMLAIAIDINEDLIRTHNIEKLAARKVANTLGGVGSVSRV